MVTAGVTNRSAATVKAQAVKLEVDGRLVDTRTVTIEPNAAASVTFPALTVANAMRATVRAGTDALPADNQFNFVLSPSRPVSVLIIQADGAASSFYLTTALGIGSSPPFKSDVLSPSRVTPASFEKRSVVILNDTTPLSTQADEALNRFVTQGGGVFVILGDRTPWNGAAPLMPGKLGSAVERLTGGGGTLGFIDHSHPDLRGLQGSARTAISRPCASSSTGRSRRRPPTRCSRASTMAPRRWWSGLWAAVA